MRGFWADIVNSPYFSYGQEVFGEPERTRFYKEVNYQKVYSNTDISEYTVQSYIHKLQELTKYIFPFERIKHLLGDDYDSPEEKKKKAEEKKRKEEEKKQEELTTVEEVTDEQAEQIENQKKKDIDLD